MSKRTIGWLYVFCLLINIILLLYLLTDFQAYNSQIQSVANDQSKLQSDQSTYGLQSVQASDDQDVLIGDQQFLSQAQATWVQHLEVVIGVMAVVGILGLIAWINTLINLSRGREWVWFVLTFFFGGIVILIYLIGGPEVPPKKSLAAQMPASPPRPSSFPTDQLLGSQASQPHPSALEVLQLRLAHGEIDEQTYQRLRDALKS